jgi:hypothetical protein
MRFVAERWATLQEIDTHWSLDDFLNALDYLESWQAAQEELAEQK